MKLYYAQGACSLSPHIVLREAGAKFDLVRVDLHTHLTEQGGDFIAINPKGYVPALELDDGQILTEGVAITQYIADTHPQAGLAPAPGTLERARLQEHLNFISTELHKSFSPLFSPDITDAARDAVVKTIERRLDYLNRVFADGRQYLMGGLFSIADAYLFTVANWANYKDIDLKRWPNIAAFMARVGSREAVQQALKAEGLV